MIIIIFGRFLWRRFCCEKSQGRCTYIIKRDLQSWSITWWGISHISILLVYSVISPAPFTRLRLEESTVNTTSHPSLTYRRLLQSVLYGRPLRIPTRHNELALIYSNRIYISHWKPIYFLFSGVNISCHRNAYKHIPLYYSRVILLHCYVNIALSTSGVSGTFMVVVRLREILLIVNRYIHSSWWGWGVSFIFSPRLSKLSGPDIFEPNTVDVQLPDQDQTISPAAQAHMLGI